jgi:hypothetical protein
MCHTESPQSLARCSSCHESRPLVETGKRFKDREGGSEGKYCATSATFKQNAPNGQNKVVNKNVLPYPPGVTPPPTSLPPPPPLQPIRGIVPKLPPPPLRAVSAPQKPAVSPSIVAEAILPTERRLEACNLHVQRVSG